MNDQSHRIRSQYEAIQAMQQQQAIPKLSSFEGGAALTPVLRGSNTARNQDPFVKSNDKYENLIRIYNQNSCWEQEINHHELSNRFASSMVINPDQLNQQNKEHDGVNGGLRVASPEKYKRYRVTASPKTTANKMVTKRQLSVKNNNSKTYEVSDSNAQFNPKVLYNTPNHKPNQTNSRMLPERVHQRQSSQFREPAKNTWHGNSASAQQYQQQQQPAKVLGLGPGMGIQMGGDGKFYASMGGVTSPAAVGANDTEEMMQTGENPQLVNSKVASDLVVQSQNSGVTNKRLKPEFTANNSAKVQNGKASANFSQAQPKRNDSKLKRGDPSADQRDIMVDSSMQEQHTHPSMKLQRSQNQKPFPAGPHQDDTTRKSYNLKSPQNLQSSGRRLSSINLQLLVQDEEESEKHFLDVNGQLRTRDAIGAAQVKKATSDQVQHNHQQNVPYFGSSSGATGITKIASSLGRHSSDLYAGKHKNETRTSAQQLAQQSSLPAKNAKTTATQQQLRMNSTNETSQSGEELNGGQEQLPSQGGSKLAQYRHPVTLDHQQKVNATPQSVSKNLSQTGDQRPFHEAAQQIIASNQVKGTVGSGSQVRKASLLQNPGHLPPLSPQQLAQLPFNSPHNQIGDDPMEQPTLTMFYQQVAGDKLETGRNEVKQLIVNTAPSSRLSQQSQTISKGQGKHQPASLMESMAQTRAVTEAPSDVSNVHGILQHGNLPDGLSNFVNAGAKYRSERMAGNPTPLLLQVENRDTALRNSKQYRQAADPAQGLSYRIVNEKRASQPPLVGGSSASGGGEEPSGVINTQDRQHQQLLLHVQDTIKRNNSIQLMHNQNPQHNQQQLIPPETGAIEGKSCIEDLRQTQNIVKHEFTVEGGSSHHFGAEVADEHLARVNAEFMRRAIQASRRSASIDDQGQEPSLDETLLQMNIAPGQARNLVMGAPQIPTINSSRQQQNQPAGLLDSPKRPDMTEANIRRARLLLEKKKKQFEQQKDPRWRLSQNQQQSPVTDQTDHQAQFEHLQKMIGSGLGVALIEKYQPPINQSVLGPSGGGPFGSDLICIPNISYKSTQQASPKLRHFGGQHPLNNQQSSNGYQKNYVVGQQISRPSRKAHQERAFQQNQGIQGKNITNLHQNRTVAQQAILIHQMQQSRKYAQTGGIDETTPLSELEAQLDPEDLRALQMIHQQLQLGLSPGLSNSSSRKNLLQAMHAAETGRIEPSIQQAQPISPISSPGKSKGKESAFFQFGIPSKPESQAQDKSTNIFFNHHGQSFVRSNESSKLVLTGRQKQLNMPHALSHPTEPDEARELAALTISDIAVPSPQASDLISSHLSDTQQQAQQQQNMNSSPNMMSNAAYMANQMVQMSIGSRSLSKMLKDAQIEAALQAFAKHRGLQPNDNNFNQSFAQSFGIGNAPQSPKTHHVTMKVHGRAQQQKDPKPKNVQPNKAPPVTLQGQSNGSLSTKPATSTTLNSNQGKSVGQKEPEESKQSLTAKKAPGKSNKPQKQRVHIFHEQDETYRSHKINKAINTINNIIRMIFKNSKGSVAITATNNTDMLSGPGANRLMEDYKKIEELQKIAKQINISIPRKFDSKASLREFFYSREFILTVKIKMQSLLHKAILTANNVPQTVIEANMCGQSPLTMQASSKEENKIYQAKKFFVGQGNNYPIVKSVLKQRYWWQFGSEESFASDCDFVWTAWKKQKHIDFLTNVNNRTKTKVKSLQKQQQNEALRGSEERINSDNRESLNETIEQKINKINSESKFQKKKKEKSEQKEKLREEKAVADMQIQKIVFPLRLYNKLEQNKQLTNKKGLFINMRKYYESLDLDPFKVLPLTFHTTQGINDPEFRKFSNYYNQLERQYALAEQKTKQAIRQYHIDRREKREAAKKRKESEDYRESESEEEETEDNNAIENIRKKYRAPQNTWIIKPGENTNRGQGITVVKTVREVEQIIGRPMRKDTERTFIIQKYIDYPLLVHKRKFDFRCYGVLTSINGSLKGYCYQDGYIRTSCREYSLDDVSDQYVHLTNDAIQQKAEDYGKFENGNKLSWQDFTKVISAQQPNLDFDFHRDIFPQIEKLIGDTFKAAFTKIDPQRLQNCFELFGYDFMLDEDFRLYLIEVNTNPCLEVCCPLLARIIPEVLDNTFKIVLDPLFPSPDLSHNRKFQLNELPQEVKYQLVFDEETEGEQIREKMEKGVRGSLREVGEEDIESDKEDELAENDADAY